MNGLKIYSYAVLNCKKVSMIECVWTDRTPCRTWNVIFESLLSGQGRQA